ncbi:TFIIB-type zinc ribbon-containing protein [Pseudidiomarina andamanensis]|uniref:Transcription factor zinc-finger domain-containing protein n=1 Tax=Pseudidiomarina andamanensis TaxID=1940690 RepID=A0AA92EV50_9GAMM|nr:zf-TFIIB domain-containing protein [Pseudidiomarina andamanensis]MDS0219012.1 zf-TFIIB domain-containing protein [Pseudidiomarina andamanensis]QGT96366.1 hypothetical protein D3795_09455 [Pseudidiomarina andamanensis]
MKCPVCKEENLVMAERQGIEIDYCPSCRGVWLDRGELDKIIERSAPQEAPVHRSAPPQQQTGHYERGYDKGYSHKKYKKKSLLGEIFDF